MSGSVVEYDPVHAPIYVPDPQYVHVCVCVWGVNLLYTIYC